ncbi:hypothetical protein TRFO_01875 [Tritrichomonas foetus]|uniref:Uncharacterized protein n=1 Tax=Tritrichomonas foetus TaxID=1144522 RepID=A0A1J4JI52_9EUKA|nr:hypothetical protein TRFO_01875 [Tritrichomonas foetus]|eukprot:OHS98814.1 hypothetical protein TRFO_01875 [Tritrichomonas foetus]
MCFLIFFFCNIWFSDSPWKDSLKRNDKNYLIVPPILEIVHPFDNETSVIDDLLSFNKNMNFTTTKYLKRLNKQKNPDKYIHKLKSRCLSQNISQACLILGRIYEFGSYNQTENLSLAYSYFLRVNELNDSSANSELSFFHRHIYKNVPKSIVEADFSSNNVESILTSSFQYETGFLRPKSCPTATKSLLAISKHLIDMYMIQPLILDYILDEDVSTKDENFTIFFKRYVKALKILSLPYPSQKHVKKAKYILKTLYKQGFNRSVYPLSLIYMNSKLNNKTRNKIFTMLDPKTIKNDPAATLLASDIFLSSTNGVFRSNHVLLDLKYLSGWYPPAMKKLGDFTYLGYYGIPRSATNSYTLFSKSAIAGYCPSMLSAASQLLGGDGVTEDCSEALKMLRDLIEICPLTEIYNKYVEKGSKVALLKMIEMRLTPSFWIDGINEKGLFSSVTDEMFKIEDIIPKITGNEALKRLCAAKNGDVSSIFWIVLKSDYHDARQWMKRLNQMHLDIPFASKVLEIVVNVKGVGKYLKGEVLNEEKDQIKCLIYSIFHNTIIIVLAMLLIFLLIIRLDMALP